MGTVVIADRRQSLVRAPSRSCHQPCAHRRQFRRNRRDALARASCRTVRLCGRDADGDSDHGCRPGACRYGLDRPAVSWRFRPRRQIDWFVAKPRRLLRSGDMSRAKLLRSMAFWTISIPFALALLAQIGFIVHQIALLEPKIGRASAGFAVSVMTFMAIAGRLSLGMVVDRFDPRLVTAASFAGQAAALLIILQSDTRSSRAGRLRSLRLFGRQSHHLAAADHSSRVQCCKFCRCHGTVERGQRNHWRAWPGTCRPGSRLERRL